MSRRDIVRKFVAACTSRNFALVSYPLADAVVMVALPILMRSHRSFTHISPPGYRLNPLEEEIKKVLAVIKLLVLFLSIIDECTRIQDCNTIH